MVALTEPLSMMIDEQEPAPLERFPFSDQLKQILTRRGVTTGAELERRLETGEQEGKG